MEYKRSETTVATKKDGIPTIALKKLNRTEHIKSEANKPKTQPTESRTGQRNEAFQNIPRDKTSGVRVFYIEHDLTILLRVSRTARR